MTYERLAIWIPAASLQAQRLAGLLGGPAREEIVFNPIVNLNTAPGHERPAVGAIAYRGAGQRAFVRWFRTWTAGPSPDLLLYSDAFRRLCRITTRSGWRGRPDPRCRGRCAARRGVYSLPCRATDLARRCRRRRGMQRPKSATPASKQFRDTTCPPRGEVDPAGLGSRRCVSA